VLLLIATTDTHTEIGIVFFFVYEITFKNLKVLRGCEDVKWLKNYLVEKSQLLVAQNSETTRIFIDFKKDFMECQKLSQISYQKRSNKSENRQQTMDWT
jgi:hypothetical protein